MLSDCLQVLYPEYDLVFLFDHSQGHARRRDNALSAQHMSKSYGGVQPMMRETTILAEEGFLGPHLPELRVGDTQSMIFLANRLRPLVSDSRTTILTIDTTVQRERPNLSRDPRSSFLRH
jgi:hypothetical protein